jgi:hypothetical protein
MRLALVFLIGLLSANLSGVLEFAIDEPCVWSEQASGAADGACPPTCTRCHCARPYDLVRPIQLATASMLAARWASPAPAFVEAAPADIFHVPKTSRL